MPFLPPPQAATVDGVRRSQHTTDVPAATAKRPHQRRRKVGSHLNKHAPSQGWSAAKCQAVAVGNSPFSFASDDNPLTVKANDANDIGNRAMIEVGRSDSPESVLRFKALDCTAVGVVVTHPRLGVVVYTWAGLWPGCTLVYTESPGRIDKEIIIWDRDLWLASCGTDAGGNPYFEWTLKHHPSHTLTIAGNAMALVDGDGYTTLESRAPWAHDSSTTALTIDGRQHIPCTLTESTARGGLRVVRLTLDRAAVEAANGVITADPSIVVSGKPDIQDAWISGAAPTANIGDWATFPTSWGKSGGSVGRALYRIIDSALPAATAVTLFRWNFTMHSVGVGTTQPACHKILPANTWVEGSSAAVTEAGASSWLSAKQGSQVWAGSAGCGTSGVDFVADASPPSVVAAASASASYSVDLIGQWVLDWLAAPSSNQGFRVYNSHSSGEGVNYAYAGSSENAPTPSFDITYSTGPTTVPSYFHGLLTRGMQ